MLHALFLIFVIAGFLFQLLATWPVTYAARIAWACWFVASLIWGYGEVGG